MGAVVLFYRYLLTHPSCKPVTMIPRKRNMESIDVLFGARTTTKSTSNSNSTIPKRNKTKQTPEATVVRSKGSVCTIPLFLMLSFLSCVGSEIEKYECAG